MRAERCTECTRLAQGPVELSGDVPAHWCLQCAEHCQVAAHVRRQQSEIDAQRALGVWS